MILCQLFSGITLLVACLPIMYSSMCHRNPWHEQAVAVVLSIWATALVLNAIVGTHCNPLAVVCAFLIGVFLLCKNRSIRAYLSKH
jgi:energy-converting hydrogenase Eha subunit A